MMTAMFGRCACPRVKAGCWSESTCVPLLISVSIFGVKGGKGGEEGFMAKDRTHNFTNIYLYCSGIGLDFEKEFPFVHLPGDQDHDPNVGKNPQQHGNTASRLSGNFIRRAYKKGKRKDDKKGKKKLMEA